MDGLRRWAEQLSQFLTEYRWLLDTYVIEFFTEDHWSKLPPSWQSSLGGAELTQLSQLLLTSPYDHQRGTTSVPRVYPLSLLAFVATAHALSLPRQPRGRRREGGLCDAAIKRSNPLSQIEGLDHVFRRHLKHKKQHEIKVLGQEVMQLSKISNCKNIIDVGSGQGHLARYLAFHCGLHVVTVDAVGCHLTAAAKFDSEVERDLQKKSGTFLKGDSNDGDHKRNKGSITHVESVIQPDATMEDFLSQLGLSAPESEEAGLPGPQFILVGLHTCGDLASTMLRVYSQSRQVVGVVSVGCCYMKLTCEETPSLDSHQTTPDNTGVPIPVSPEGDVTRSMLGGVMTCAQKEQARPTIRGEEVEDQRDETSTHHVEEHRPTCTPPSPQLSPELKHLPGRGARVFGYPLSQFVAQLPAPHGRLSYEAREVACHSLDAYREKLREGSHHLKVHCHRAVVETILRKHGMRRSQVKISRGVSKLPFTEYATAVLKALGLPPSELHAVLLFSPPSSSSSSSSLPSISSNSPSSSVAPSSVESLLAQWPEVVVFFMLRLTAAPCAESLVLLDRALYLREQGLDAELSAAFEPTLSPRNIIITSHK